MQVRHLVARDNVDPSGHVIDPTAARHGSLRGRQVWAIAGPIDAETHLNLDFAGHRLDTCVVVEALATGAAVVDGSPVSPAGQPAAYLLAATPLSAHIHRGPVDFGARRAAWLAVLRERRKAAATPFA